jgi:amidase
MGDFMTVIDTEWLDATAQAELLRRKEIPPDACVRAAISRISRTNERINAVVSTRFEAALVEARHIESTAPFAGVPVLVKDLGCGIAGEPMWCGNRGLKRINHRAARDGAITEALRAAGFVILGRTNTAEFGATITTEPQATGPCVNPWDLTLTSGGSSGGSAAAVAAGHVPVAHGTDASGSVRIPAAVCGVIGLKPTNGTLPLDDSDGGGWFGLSTPGILGRTVRDVQGTFVALRPAPAGPTQTAAPTSLSIAMVLPADDPETAAVMKTTAAKLRTLGHRVAIRIPSFLNEEYWRRNFLTLVGAGVASEIRYWEREIGTKIYPDQLDYSTAQIAEIGLRATGTAIAQAYKGMREYRVRVARWWGGADGADLVFTPVLAHPQAPLGWLSDPTEGVRRVRRTMLYTPQFNMSGDPALALPLGQSAAGLPIGLQLAAAHGREDLLFHIATELEREIPWAHRVPPRA